MSDEERNQAFLQEWRDTELYFPFEFNYKNVTDWDYATAMNPYLTSDGKVDQSKTALACQYVKVYGFNIDPINNPRIKDFDEIVEIAKDKGINLVFNILPENIQMANYLVGKELVYLMKSNRDFLIARYKEMGVKIIDNLEKVPCSEFVDYNFPTEHYAEFGRKIIAYNLAHALLSFYPDQRVEFLEYQPYLADVQYQLISDFDFRNERKPEVEWKMSSTKAIASDSSVYLLGDEEFPITCKINYRPYSTNLLRQIEVKVDCEKEEKELFLVTKIVDQSQSTTYYCQKSIKFNEETDSASFIYNLPSASTEKDELIVYLWNPYGGNIQLKDLNIHFDKLENPRNAEFRKNDAQKI